MRKARLESPDLLILDVMLPGFDGFEICHRLRAEPATAKMPIMMLSSKQQKSDQDAASKVGANAFLSKPVDRTLLLAKVAGLLGIKNLRNRIRARSEPPLVACQAIYLSPGFSRFGKTAGLRATVSCFYMMVKTLRITSPMEVLPSFTFSIPSRFMVTMPSSRA